MYKSGLMKGVALVVAGFAVGSVGSWTHTTILTVLGALTVIVGIVVLFRGK